MKKTTFSLVLFFGALAAFSQGKDNPETALLNQQRQLKSELIQKAKTDSLRTARFVSNTHIPVSFTNSRNDFAELESVTQAGVPLYNQTSNAGAAITTRANKLYSGGSLGLNIQGQGMLVGVWDGGGVRAAHTDFGGRVSVQDAGSFSDHSTHVAGTIIGNGTAATYRGMAFQANAVTYNWTNDLTEIVEELDARDVFVLSNHSYGYSVFNDDGDMILPLYYFGAYIEKSRDIDNIMYTYRNKNYLTVVAAGNDRQEQAQITNKSGYDLLTGVSASKNSITVGAVQEVLNYTMPSNVILAPFSNYGPTDDGRIKPDLVGKGMNVNSCLSTSNTAHGPMSGTSMATPNVTGTLLLLQQYYNQLNGHFMRAATLKGLALHTCDEAGTGAGPDYKNGWGLLNAEKAANAITRNATDNTIRELTLNSGQQMVFELTADGTASLEASISWTDPAGVINGGIVDDPTPALVNDLDIRIVKDETTYFPWKLNPASPLFIATKADNIVDPFEKIQIDGPTGVYQITVSHKGTLNNPQDFSLIVTGATVQLGVDHFDFKKLSVWPNPVANQLNIRYRNESSGATTNTVEIHDLQGRLITRKSNPVLGSDFETAMDVSALPSGVYVVKIIHGNATYSSKFIRK